VVGHPAGASVRVLSSNDSGNEVDLVHARGPVTIVRSVTYMRGWHVRVTATDGRARTIPILRVGLIQGVKLPAGTWTVTFLYRPRGLISGVIGSLAGLLALVATGVVWLVRRRRATAAEPAGQGAAHREAPGDR